LRLSFNDRVEEFLETCRSGSSNQNNSLRANWSWRELALPVEEMAPKPGSPKPESGAAKLGVLVRFERLGAQLQLDPLVQRDLAEKRKI